MAWDTKSQGSQSGGQGWVKEGNFEILLIREEPIKVRFLTVDVDVEKIMSEQTLTREQAQEYINTVLLFDEWVMPISHWEHKIPAIAGQRYFSTVPCQGKLSCPLCMENDTARANGVTENKFLPYPVSKKFYVPAFVYSLNKVLFIRQTEQFFDDIATYINKHGSNSAFELSKTGKGFNTRYKSIYDGEAEGIPDDLKYLSPKELDFDVSQADIDKQISGQGGGSPRESSNDATPVTPAPTGDVSEFKIPFGNHKGKTINEVYIEGDEAYLKFIVENSAGLLKDNVVKFLADKK